MESKCVADIEGSWVEQPFQSGLIERCKRNWNIPVIELTNEVLATYLRQKIALQLIIPEARRRIDAGFDDDSELFDGELAEALQRKYDD